MVDITAAQTVSNQCPSLVQYVSFGEAGTCVVVHCLFR